MTWATAILLRLVALAAGLFFVYCEADGTYEFLLSQQSQHAIDFVVLAGTGFAVALGLLPMYAGHAVKHRQRGIAAGCWLALPIVMAVVYYAAIQRTGGAADQAEVERLRNTRAGTLAVRTEQDASATWETAREAAKRECGSGPVRQQRGPKCLEAEGKRDAAWAAVTVARKDLAKTPETKPDSGARRAVAFLPFLTEAQVRLYQPMLIPLGISMLASVFLSIAMLLHTPPMPWPWRRRALPQAKDAVVIDVEAESKAPALSPPQRPKLVTSSAEGAGSIPKILHQILEPAGGKRVEIKDCHGGYAATCRAEGKRAVPPVQFIEPLKQFCRRSGIKTKTIGDRFYLLDVKLAPAISKTGAGPESSTLPG
jgi:hypothetical protein